MQHNQSNLGCLQVLCQLKFQHHFIFYNFDFCILDTLFFSVTMFTILLNSSHSRLTLSHTIAHAENRPLPWRFFIVFWGGFFYSLSKFILWNRDYCFFRHCHETDFLFWYMRFSPIPEWNVLRTQEKDADLSLWFS